MLKKIAKLALINVSVLFVLLLGVEIIFGNWLRPLDIDDLKRFSIPIGVNHEFDVSTLYPGGTRAVYRRDQYGLRGNYATFGAIDVLTVGGSTTDQRFLDEKDTWQSVAMRRLAASGTRAVIANAGVDGQSMTGHKFDFDNWFPLLPGLHPKFVVFYVGVNDVLKRGDRKEYDDSLDASSWRVKSALWQVVRIIRGNLQARSAGVVHGTKRDYPESAFTANGLLDEERRTSLARAVSEQFVRDAAALRQRAESLGAKPVFVTQSAFAWNAGAGPVRGLGEQVNVHGTTLNYADVSYLHQQMNASLMAWCVETGTPCFDAASELALDPSNYYDFVHTDPVGARKFGEYLGDRLQGLLSPTPNQVVNP